MPIEHPEWTVITNIVSPESGKWIGTCWEFFDGKVNALECEERHKEAGNTVVVMRPWHYTDAKHLGACHTMSPVKLSDFR